MKDLHIARAHVSALSRAQDTLKYIIDVLGYPVETSIDAALNERDYGIYTGKNKWEVQKEIGEDIFHALRRGWDVPIPGGESLKDVYARVVPYFEREVLPELRAGKNVLIVAHGNCLRALMKYLDKVSDRGAEKLAIKTGEVVCYEFDAAGRVQGKEVRVARA